MVKSMAKKLDETAISVVEVCEEGWFIHDIIHGRWGVRETSLQIIKAAKKYHCVSLGIEKGSLKNAIMPYLEDQMRRLNTYPNVVALTHGGKKKTERIMWSLQGRFQNGRIFFKKGASYVRPLSNQLLDFPNPMVHDDLIDSLAYIDQIATVGYFDNSFMIDDYQPLDLIAGF
jgi:predicted phage terminase large subunit-like protein